MANSGSNSALKFTVVAVAVIAGSAFTGWLLAGGGHTSASAPSAQAPAQVSNADTPAPDDAAGVHPSAPRNRSDDYTAPGAPSIRIREEVNPTLKRPKPADSNAPKPDPEASQEDPPKLAANPAPPSATADPNAPPDAAAPPPAATDSSTPPAAPGDADYEKTPAPAGDGEAAQQGDTASHGPIYRVQAGTFDQARNAHMLADVLKDRGYTTSTIAERRSDKTVYHVQIGAYRNKATAKQSALDLQKMGYPAYVAGGG